jgi:hypothetical protein
MLLRALGNPYAYKGVPAGRSELLAAIEICSRTRWENQEALFGRRPGYWRLLWRGLRWAWRDLTTADASFRQYVEDFTRRAQMHAREGGEGEPMVSPSEFHLHRHLCEVEGWEPESAWDASVGMAWACYSAYAEWKGWSRGVSAYDEGIRKFLERLAAHRKAGEDEAEAAVQAEMVAFIKAHKGA